LITPNFLSTEKTLGRITREWLLGNFGKHQHQTSGKDYNFLMTNSLPHLLKGSDFASEL
jgi:hypothetical protein